MKKTNFRKLFAGLSAACVMASAIPTVAYAADPETSKGIAYGVAN